MARKVTPKKIALKKPVVRRSSQAAAKKSIIGTGTLVTLVVFAAVILLGIFVNRQKESAAAAATPIKGTTSIFGQSDGTLVSIEIKSKTGETTQLARDAKNIWALELPEKVAANQSAVEAAASQVSALQIVKTLDAADLSIFGLDAPAYVITLKFADGKTRALEIGSATPTNSGYYARVDKNKIIITDLSGIDALTNMVAAPPYLNTPTPATLPSTPTLIAPIEATPTP